jgi:general nucleoside transport system permease protein
MLLKLEKRPEPSRFMLFATPVAAVLLTIVIGAGLFQVLGYDGLRTVREIFFTPIIASYKWQDVATKAAPLILIALGLSLGNQAKVWNIGAEGQYIAGALAGAWVAYHTPGVTGSWIIAFMLLAGVAGGAAWAAIPAFLKARLNVNEVLTSLMLVYVALQLLGYLVTGPWKDPNGQNFPQSAPFTDAQLLPPSIAGTFVPPGLLIAFVLMLVFWLVVSRSVYGFQVRVVGAAPSAARYAGFSAKGTVWSTMLISGGMAGLAGILEASSQSGQLNLGFPSNYGFTAIIVSFLGRLHPIGVFIAGIVLAITYVGGQVAQTTVHVPSASGGIFQALMLFFILAGDVLVRHRLRFTRAKS